MLATSSVPSDFCSARTGRGSVSCAVHCRRSWHLGHVQRWRETICRSWTSPIGRHAMQSCAVLSWCWLIRCDAGWWPQWDSELLYITDGHTADRSVQKSGEWRQHARWGGRRRICGLVCIAWRLFWQQIILRRQWSRQRALPYVAQTRYASVVDLHWLNRWSGYTRNLHICLLHEALEMHILIYSCLVRFLPVVRDNFTFLFYYLMFS